MRTDSCVNGGERGAVLVHVAIGLIAFMAFSTFVFDYGVFWLSRRQAQNAADAGALAGATALAYDDFDDRTDTGPAKESAFLATQANGVFGQVPSVIPASDITFPACPDDGTNACIRVDTYRTAARSNPLPTFFGGFIGLMQQDVRATATAKVLIANATDCLKPWGVIDKWQENQDPGGWTTESTFDKYDRNGNLDPGISPPDYYQAPTSTPAPYGDKGTGFYPFNNDGTPSPWYGQQISLKVGDQSDFSFASGWFAGLALPNPVCSQEDGQGADCYRTNIKGCTGIVYKIGDELELNNQPGQMVGPTGQGVEGGGNPNEPLGLVERDPNARWVDGVGIVDSCCATSPRVVAVPLVNPDIMSDAWHNKNGRTTVPISNILGFFVEGFDQAEKAVIGRLVSVPGLYVAAGQDVGSASFAKTISLIR